MTALSAPGDMALIVDGMRADPPGHIPFVEVRVLPEHDDFYRHYFRTDMFPAGWKIGDTIRVNEDYEYEIVPQEDQW